MPIIGTLASAISGNLVGDRMVYSQGSGANTSPNNYGAASYYINIAVLATNTSFGNLTVGRTQMAAFASTTRGISTGGGSYADGNGTDVIDYCTIATVGNFTSFGNLTTPRRYMAGSNSSTRGITFGGEIVNGVPLDRVDYVTMATTGNATTFGALTRLGYAMSSCSSPTRAIAWGGYPLDTPVPIQYVTTATTGNTSNFGDNLGTATDYAVCAASNSTRGIRYGNFSENADNIVYITIATTGNAASFGTMLYTSADYYNFASAGTGANATRIVQAGSYYTLATSTGGSTTSEYVTIASTGNGTNFATITNAGYAMNGMSCANGGL